MKRGSGQKTPAPTDKACSKAWKQIMQIAEAHALITFAYSGVATLAIPEEQRKAGTRANVLQMHCMTVPTA